MSNRLNNVVTGIAILSMPIIVTFILNLMIWLATDLTFGQSLLVTFGVEALLGVGIYFWIRNEVRKFNVNIEVDEEDGIL